MSDNLTVTDQITELESRQDEVLRRLDELNLILERAIAEWMGKPGKANEKAA